MKYFKLKKASERGAPFGPHVEDGQVYQPGQLVPSKLDLASLFPHKFDAADAVGAVDPVADAALGNAAPQVDEGRDDTTGDTDITNAQVPQVVEEETEADVDLEASSSLGANVTAGFPDAIAAGCLVFKKGSWYYIASADDKETAINDKGLRKDAVGAFIDEL